MFNNSVFLKHGICDIVTVFLTLLPSLWTQEWAIGKGLYLLAQTNLQLLNASVQDCTWHCALRTVTFQKTDLFETCGSLEFSLIPPRLGFHESPAEVGAGHSQGWVLWSPSRVPLCSGTGGWRAQRRGRAGWFLWGCGWSWRITSSAVHQGEVLKIYYWILLLFTAGFNLFLNTVS